MPIVFELFKGGVDESPGYFLKESCEIGGRVGTVGHGGPKRALILFKIPDIVVID